MSKTNCSVCGVEIKKDFTKCYKCQYGGNTTNIEAFTNKVSEGEEFLKMYLNSLEVKFQEQVKILNLKNDTKQFRVADFYLPKFDLYIEFNGRWNDERSRYTEKMRVYDNNNIPCVHLYPENLGVLDFILDLRIQETLKRYHRYDKLKKYFWFKMWGGESFRLLFVALFIVLIPAMWVGDGSRLPWFIVIGFGLSYQFWHVFKTYKRIYIKNTYPLFELYE